MATVEKRKDGGLSEACIKKELAGKAGMKRKRKKKKRGASRAANKMTGQ